MAIPNRWHLRHVASTSSKACYICYKSTAAVLITADSKDFFYICEGHLSDTSFCAPVVDQEAVQRAAKEAREREIEKVKKEYEEKQRKRKAKKEKEKDEDKEKEREKAGHDSKSSEKEDVGKGKSVQAESSLETKTEQGDSIDNMVEKPRIFTLHKTFYQMRLDRLRNAEMTRRNRERLKNSSNFPSVPTGDP